jgi:hypothetical protein
MIFTRGAVCSPRVLQSTPEVYILFFARPNDFNWKKTRKFLNCQHDTCFANTKKFMYHKRLSWLCFCWRGRKRATLLLTIREYTCSLYRSRAKKKFFSVHLQQKIMLPFKPYCKKYFFNEIMNGIKESIKLN